MTLLEIERLIRKISDLLQEVGNPAIAPKLAEDYAAACQATNLRLQQCEAMIKAGDRLQAIQLAETAPNLLDLVTALEFRGADDWRSYCQQNSLAGADRIDARSVGILNECYAQGITTDHPLYAAYRSAVLNRNEDQALKALQSITRLNPADANAASELTRLDAKVLAGKVQRLGNLLEGEPTPLVAEVEAIEAFGFHNKPAGEVWRKAQTVRCEYLLEETARLKNSSLWLEALANIDFIHRLQAEFKVELRGDALMQLSALETWARDEQEKDRKEREFQVLLGELRNRIHHSEEKDTSARYVELPELRDDYEALHKTWRSLTDFTRPIPEEAGSGFRKRSMLLEAEITRRTAIRRRVIVAIGVAVLVTGAVIAWIVLGQMKAREFAGRLQESINQRQVHAAERLLETLHTGEKSLLGISSVNTAAAKAETFLAREHALQANFEAAFGKLPQSPAGEPDASRLSRMADQLVLAQNALNGLAPDVKAENEPRLQAFEKAWQNYLAESGAAVNGPFDQWVSSAEKRCDELDYRAPLEKTTAQLNALGDLVQKITDIEAGFTNHLSLRSDLLQRSASVQEKFAAYEGELRKLDGGMAAIRSARTMKDFSEGIGTIASSEFSTSPAAAAATLVQSLNANEETALRFLLGATNAGTWAYIGNAKFTHFVPEVVMPAERQIFQGLNDDPAVSASYLWYHLQSEAEGTEAIEWITIGAFQTSDGVTLSNSLTGTITENSDDRKQIMAWVPSASPNTVNFENHDYTYYNNHFKLSPEQATYRVKCLGKLNETAAFHSVGLEAVWMGGTYEKPLLDVLDAIKDSRDGSPVFRAYLFLRLTELMNLQPDAWGITFCPAMRAHEAQIRKIVSERLGSGDWFVPAKANVLASPLEQFFESAKSVSYAEQARGLLAIARDASKNGLQYVGFVGLDGKLNYIDNSNPGEVWGYSAGSGKPMLLAATMETNKPLIAQGMPLSPLFALGSASREYLTRAGVNPEDASFQGALPPLFQGPTQR